MFNTNDPLYWQTEGPCPRLFLAPMEGLADGHFRRAIASIGGFDEACTEFLRVPRLAHVPSIAKQYDPHETAPIPQACQLMGSDPILMAEVTQAVVERGAPRVEINCGCPSNTVNGKGAGASLLKDPEHLHKVTAAMVAATDTPVTAKLRLGFDDTTLFKEILDAAESAGAAFIALHARTRKDGYAPPARWEYLAAAKEQLKVPLIGNGDIFSVADAKRMLEQTGCDALMIGRGAVRNPWLFHEIKAELNNEELPSAWPLLSDFVKRFVDTNRGVKLSTQVNKLKQLIRFLLHDDEKLRTLLRERPSNPDVFLDLLLPSIEHKSVEKKELMTYK